MLISIVGAVIVFSIVILSHELGHFIMAKKMGVRVEIFSLGLGPKIWSLRRGETEYAISAIPFGGYVKMAGDELGGELKGEEWEFYSKPIYKRFNIIVAGSAVNYILGILLFCAVFMTSPTLSSRIGELKEGYPAQEVGLKENDRIVEIDGWGIRHWFDVLRILAISEDRVNIAVERNGEILEFDVQGKIEKVEDISGRPVDRRIVGILPLGEVTKYGFFESIAIGIHETLFITRFTFVIIWKMLTGTLSVKLVSGPIGIFAITGQAARVGLIPLLGITALLNVSLAIINLLPFPVLDGGHILFLGIEKLKGRPLDKKVQEVVQQIALVLLITFVLVVSWNDILRFF